MQTFNLDLSIKRIVPLLHVKQRNVGTKISVNITDNGTEYAIPADVSFSVWYSGKSGEGNYTTIDGRSAFVIKGNTVTVELIMQMLNNPGEHLMCLVMNSADGSQIGLWNIPYYVEAIPGADSQAAQQYYQAFLQAQKKAEEAAAAAAKSEENIGQSEEYCSIYATRAINASANATHFAEVAQKAAEQSVTYTAQPLTDEQQAQARENIGAVGRAEMAKFERTLSGIAETRTELFGGLIPDRYVNGDGSITDFNTYLITDYIPIADYKRVEFRITAFETTASERALWCARYDKDKNFIAGSRVNFNMYPLKADGTLNITASNYTTSNLCTINTQFTYGLGIDVSITDYDDETAFFVLFALRDGDEITMSVAGVQETQVYEYTFPAVTYTAQDLSPEQKAQVRENIGTCEYDPVLPVEIIEGSYVTSTGIESASSSFCCTDFIEVPTGFTVRLENAYVRYSAAVIALDKNKKVTRVLAIDDVGGSGKSITIDVTIAEGEKYIRASGKSGTAISVTLVGDPIKACLQAVAAVKSDVEKNTGTTELVDGWYNAAYKKIDKLFNEATKKPMITFIDDDTASAEGVKRFRDVCIELGISGTYACITSRLDADTSGVLKNALLEYENEGFHIAMHAHERHDLFAKVDQDIYDGNELDAEELKALERDFVTCMRKLKSYGFLDTDFWITPGGSSGYVNVNLARKWGIHCFVLCGNNGYEGTNPRRGRYGLYRPSLGADDGEHKASQTLDEIKTIIDNASQDNGWVIVCTHMCQAEWSNESAVNRFKDLVNYARGKGFEVKTLNEAWRIREPIYRLYETF